MDYLIGIDQSTQGTKALLVDMHGKVCHRVYLPHEQIISECGWVSHDPLRIFENVVSVAKAVILSSGVDPAAICGLAISNQRETCLAWNRVTGEPAENAIVWQCARGKEISDELKANGAGESVQMTTGIPLSPYFPATKMSWIMKHSSKALEWAGKDELCLGTIDSWLVYKLTQRKCFYTDYSNASRTQLFNLHSLSWDEDICGLFHVPVEALPQVLDSNGEFGKTTLEGFLNHEIGICAVMGDSHSALYAQGCVVPGMTKVTYGTGSSIMMNIGKSFIASRQGLVTSLAWGMDGEVDYVFEGNINYTGAVITWMEKDLGLLSSDQESADMAFGANSDDATYLVPAFSGLGAPYWNDGVRALVCGMSRTTGKREFVKAGLDSIAYQIVDVIELMKAEMQVDEIELRVDGGPTKNPYLMQMQADIAGQKVLVSDIEELSAYGVVRMALNKLSEAFQMPSAQIVYAPKMSEPERRKHYAGWKMAVARILFEPEVE